jgi:hypothetical protein
MMKRINEYVSRLANSKIGMRIVAGAAGLAALVGTTVKADADVFGTVYDEHGTALPGVEVIVSGADTQVTHTDTYGQYNLAGDVTGRNIRFLKCTHLSVYKGNIQNGQFDACLLESNDGIWPINSVQEMEYFRDGKIMAGAPNSSAMLNRVNGEKIPVYLQGTWTQQQKEQLEAIIGGLDPGDAIDQYPGSIEAMRQEDIYQQTGTQRNRSNPGVNVKLGTKNATTVDANYDDPNHIYVWYALIEINSVVGGNAPDVQNEFCQDAYGLGSVGYPSCLRSISPTMMTARDARHLNAIDNFRNFEATHALGHTLNDMQFYDCPVGVEPTSWGAIKALYK